MDTISVLILASFTEAQLDKLRAVSPRLDIQQRPGADFADWPAPDQIEVLYAWGEHLAEAHRLPNLRWIQMHTAGIDRVLSLPVWDERVLITSASGIHPVPMAEHALAMMLAFRWNLPTMFRNQYAARWPEDRWDTFAGPELRGSTVGIIGYGTIGRELARLTHALGMRVLALNRSGERRPEKGFVGPGLGDPDASLPARMYATADLLAMLPECDYVVMLAPLTPETEHWFGAEAFRHMKSSAYFFNLSRGAVVDEAALIEALQAGQIRGAGLDVFEQEPLPDDSPLWGLRQVIISPHVSGVTLSYDELTTDLFAENLRRYLAGEPLLNLVEKERGY